jgi:hypothetical protein
MACYRSLSNVTPLSRERRISNSSHNAVDVGTFSVPLAGCSGR